MDIEEHKRRIKEGMALLRERGKPIGRPPKATDAEILMYDSLGSFLASQTLNMTRQNYCLRRARIYRDPKRMEAALKALPAS